jgi:hypothetical protein
VHRGDGRGDRGDLARGAERRGHSDQAVRLADATSDVRASILLWSTVSGAILGFFIDATLIGVAVLVGAVVPALSARLHHRWFATSSAVVLALIPLGLAILGFLEGQLKAR